MMILVRHLGLFAILLVAVFFAWQILGGASSLPNKPTAYGLTFSPKQARDLGLDWQAVFRDIVGDLGVKKLRLSAYWDVLESEKGSFDWSETDWLLAQAEKNEVEVILAIGTRLPRWPECHLPAWVKNSDEQVRQAATLDYLRQVVGRYRDRPAIKAWQVENEPFLKYFGECPPFDKAFLDQEIALVRSLDSRPIVLTDSGELSWWVGPASRADIFGTTMYRNTYSQVLERYVHYPIGPSFFRVKKSLAGLWAKPEKWLVIELQTEPWSNKSYHLVDQAERDKTMSPEKFEEMIDFANQTGFGEFYLWGAEWWYWEKEHQGRDFFWQRAKKLFNQ